MQLSSTEDLSPVVLEYLELIYSLRAEGEDAFAVTLADHLGVSRANASATIQRLVRDGLVAVSGRQIELTAEGRVGAETGLRRHRITERFLIEVLRISWEAVHLQARSFERGLSPLLLERIDERVGFPRTCPHGNPIPREDLDASSYLQARQARRLTGALSGAPQSVLLLSKLAETSAAFLATCAAAGLLPGASLSVEGLSPDGALQILGPTGRITLPSALAAHIWVTAEV